MSGWLRWWKGAVGRLERGLAPRADVCLWCGGRSGRQAGGGEGRRLPVCARCAADVPWIADVVCGACGRAEACPDCARRNVSHVIANRAAVQYTPFMKEWISRYKYRGDERLAPLFEEMAAHAFGRLRETWDDSSVPTIVTFVPLSRRRLEERGFNQAERMAEGIASRYGAACVPLLLRVRHTEKQSYKSRRERLESLDRAFAADEAGAAAARGMMGEGGLRAVIVDDIYTTGSTLQECGAILKQALGADRVDVYGVTWAR